MNDFRKALLTTTLISALSLTAPPTQSWAEENKPLPEATANSNTNSNDAARNLPLHLAISRAEEIIKNFNASTFKDQDTSAITKLIANNLNEASKKSSDSTVSIREVYDQLKYANSEKLSDQQVMGSLIPILGEDERSALRYDFQTQRDRLSNSSDSASMILRETLGHNIFALDSSAAGIPTENPKGTVGNLPGANGGITLPNGTNLNGNSNDLGNLNKGKGAIDLGNLKGGFAGGLGGSGIPGAPGGGLGGSGIPGISGTGIPGAPGGGLGGNGIPGAPGAGLGGSGIPGISGTGIPGAPGGGLGGNGIPGAPGGGLGDKGTVIGGATISKSQARKQALGDIGVAGVDFPFGDPGTGSRRGTTDVHSNGADRTFGAGTGGSAQVQFGVPVADRQNTRGAGHFGQDANEGVRAGTHSQEAAPQVHAEPVVRDNGGQFVQTGDAHQISHREADRLDRNARDAEARDRDTGRNAFGAVNVQPGDGARQPGNDQQGGNGSAQPGNDQQGGSNQAPKEENGGQSTGRGGLAGAAAAPIEDASGLRAGTGGRAGAAVAPVEDAGGLRAGGGGTAAPSGGFINSIMSFFGFGDSNSVQQVNDTANTKK